MDLSSLSASDREHLARLEKKYQLIRDRTVGVATRRHTGFFCGGRGGIGKSTCIEDELRRRGVPYVLTNTHLTGRGLVDRLYAHPESIHLIEDVEESVRDPRAVGVLKSALWGTRRDREGDSERLVTWGAHGASIEFLFSGGICMTSNLELRNLPNLAALKTRISWLDLRVTNEEVAAGMREIALGGYKSREHLVEPAQCLEIVEFVVSESTKVNRDLDLRLLVNSFEDYLQVEELDAGCCWQDLVASRIRERVSIVGPVLSYETRARRKVRELEVAREIVGLSPEARLHAWQERVSPPGNSRATMYRRLNDLAKQDAADLEI